MRKSVVAVAALSLLLSCFATTSSGQDSSKQKTGTIEGTISVRGVRSPENVLVYVEQAAGTYQPPKKPVQVDQKKLSFFPHVQPILRGTTVKFANSDPILHNIFWPRSKNGAYPARNLGTWGKGGSRTFKFDALGDVILLCNVHPEMEGHVVVLQNPFFDVVGKDGDYEIKNVPAGTYTVRTWYVKPKRLRSKSAEVTVEAGKAAELDFSLSRR